MGELASPQQYSHNGEIEFQPIQLRLREYIGYDWINHIPFFLADITERDHENSGNSMFFRPGVNLRSNRAISRAIKRGSSRSFSNALRKIQNPNVVLESVDA